MASLYTRSADRKFLTAETMGKLSRMKGKRLVPHLTARCGPQRKNISKIKCKNFIGERGGTRTLDPMIKSWLEANFTVFQS